MSMAQVGFCRHVCNKDGVMVDIHGVAMITLLCHFGGNFSYLLGTTAAVTRSSGSWSWSRTRLLHLRLYVGRCALILWLGGVRGQNLDEVDERAIDYFRSFSIVTTVIYSWKRTRAAEHTYLCPIDLFSNSEEVRSVERKDEEVEAGTFLSTKQARSCPDGV